MTGHARPDIRRLSVALRLHYGLNFPKSWGSMFSRYSLSLSASSEGLGEGSSVSTPLWSSSWSLVKIGRPHAEGERDAVGGTRVHLEDVVVAADQQLGEVGVLLHRADHHPAEVAAEPDEDLLEEIVGQRALRLHALQLHGDGARLRGPDPDRAAPAPLLLPQDDHRRVGGPVEAEMGHGDFDHAYSYRGTRSSAVSRVPARRDTSDLLRRQGVDAMPMLCSLSRAISWSTDGRQPVHRLASVFDLLGDHLRRQRLVGERHVHHAGRDGPRRPRG